MISISDWNKKIIPLIISKKFAVACSVLIVLYFISDYFFTDTALYLAGGLIGILSKAIGLKSFFPVWIILLVAFIVLSFKLKNKFVWLATLVIIGILLYLINVCLYEVLPDITSKALRYLHISLSILLKSTALALIYCKSSKERNLT